MFRVEGTVDYLNGKTSAISFDDIYPIGSIYISMTAGSVTDLPAAFTAGGRQWTRVGTGRCLWGANEDNSNLGDNITAGLPNITGYFPGERTTITEYWTNVDGAFYKTNTEGRGGHSGRDSDNTNVGFDASRSSDVYGKSSTVQPPAVGVVFWKRVA